VIKMKGIKDNNMKKIVIIGGGGHAKAVIEIVKAIKEYEIIGYVDPQDMGVVLGVEYLGDDSNLAEIKEKYKECSAVLGLGIRISSQRRKEVAKNVEGLGFMSPSIISPNAIIASDVVLGKGIFINHTAVINASSVIGDYCVINTSSIVEHDCKIEQVVYISPGAVVCGGVEIGEGTVIGANATIVQYKNICNDCLIGAGSVVVEHCVESGTYLGIPAKIVKKN